MQILNDFSTSVHKALEEIDPNYLTYPGLVVCGTHSPHDIVEMIEEIKKAREEGTPFLGICFGHQLAAVEYARNVLDIADAESSEWHYNENGPATYVVAKLPSLKVGLHDGESYWNNYEVVEGFDSIWKKAENFITCQYHPEYQSSKDKPHPLLVKFLDHAKMAM